VLYDLRHALRNLARRTELTIKTALGADRTRLVRAACESTHRAQRL